MFGLLYICRRIGVLINALLVAVVMLYILRKLMHFF